MPSNCQLYLACNSPFDFCTSGHNSLLTRVKYIQKSMFFVVAYHSTVILQTQGYRAWHWHESLQTQPVPVTYKRFWNDDDNIRNIHRWTLGVWHIKMFTKKLKVYLYSKKKVNRYQHSKKVVLKSQGVRSFAIRLVSWLFLTRPWEEKFYWEFKLHKNLQSILLIKNVFLG